MFLYFYCCDTSIWTMIKQFKQNNLNSRSTFQTFLTVSHDLHQQAEFVKLLRLISQTYISRMNFNTQYKEYSIEDIDIGLFCFKSL